MRLQSAIPSGVKKRPAESVTDPVRRPNGHKFVLRVSPRRAHARAALMPAQRLSPRRGVKGQQGDSSISTATVMERSIRSGSTTFPAVIYRRSGHRPNIPNHDHTPSCFPQTAIGPFTSPPTRPTIRLTPRTPHETPTGFQLKAQGWPGAARRRRSRTYPGSPPPPPNPTL